ncbi:MAG: ester cyclase [Flavobacteriaceae bacterium]
MKVGSLVVLMVIFFSFSCRDHKGGKNGDLAMHSYEQLLKENFHSFIEHAWNKANMDSLRNVLDENYTKHLNGIQIVDNLNEMEANMHVYFQGFPDGKVAIENMKISNNNLFVQWVYRGTNTGIFGEFPPTGKKVMVGGHTTIQFNSAGKMIKEDVYFNELELLQQLGYTLNPPVLE